MSLRAAQSTREILKHLTSGPGAAKLSPNVSKIALTFALKGKNESAGARHFLQENLPRIRYNNPNVEYQVSKVLDSSIKPTVAVHFSNGRSKVIEIPRVQSNVIVDQIFTATA
ncbi:uncharacterized protein EV154DRAFT_49203 [Mucor mucedo]|uniref:Ribosomal protein/NADH dehydrogenase domain-containing protein n=1 Tax=Mucor saturninus TaxID=64648 RepID=A0A8H7RG52_9FUNG|nr:uncharacterized protein EV154DRAFT_49203 [Mucor mucedo]KAG2210551.1 hypothetical protein INT47_002493 [Mucor saturninus]KAI7894993.1 hypothetical protein EV154DRAFT_49203 [Mucor mucedo]